MRLLMAATRSVPTESFSAADRDLLRSWGVQVHEDEAPHNATEPVEAWRREALASRWIVGMLIVLLMLSLARP